MLRIERSENGEVVMTISGRMDEESIAELETRIQAETSGRPIVLDVKDLILAGQEAVDFLARCEAAGLRLVHCAPYVREWIARQKRDADASREERQTK